MYEQYLMREKILPFQLASYEPRLDGTMLLLQTICLCLWIL